MQNSTTLSANQEINYEGYDYQNTGIFVKAFHE